MKLILVTVFVLTHVIAKEELNSDIDALLSDPKLAAEFYKVVKRLGIDVPAKPSEAADEEKHQTCRNKVYENTIIRTSDSREAGAKFLRSFENVKSNENCYDECCNTDGCDLAVYGQGDTTKHNCYLFHCKDDVTNKNRCVFNNYTGYVSTTVTKVKVVSKPLDNLDDLDLLKNMEVADTTVYVPPTTTTPKPTPPPTERPHTVALGGVCHSKLSCEDPNAECLDGMCQCKMTFYKKQRVCREICDPEKEFECRTRGTSRRGPDCIASSLVCDETHDCADGSDELNCPTKATPVRQNTWLSTSSKHDSAEDNTNKQDTKYDLPESSNDSSENTKDESHYGFPPFEEHINWDYDDEDNDDLVDKDLEKDTAAATDSRPKSSSSAEQKVSEDKTPDVTAKNTMPVISWADEESDFDRKTPSNPTKLNEPSSSQKDLTNLAHTQKGGDANNRGAETTRASSKHTETQKPRPHLQVPSRSRGGRPEALPRPTPEVDSIPDIIDTSESDTEVSPDDTQLSKDNSIPMPYDNDNWSDFIKNSDISPPQKPIDSTPDDLPYGPDQLDYHQNPPYHPSRPYNPLPPHYGPNQLGRYPNYRYPPYNQPYPGYSLDYPDYEPYFTEQDQDLRNSGFSPPTDPNYPGRGYRPKPELPGRRPTEDDKGILVNHKGTVDTPDASQQLPDNIIDTESPGTDLIDQPDDKSDESSKTSSNEDNDGRSQEKTDSQHTDKDQEEDNSNVKDHPPAKDQSVTADKPATQSGTSDSHSDTGTKTTENTHSKTDTKSKDNQHKPGKVEIVEEKETFVSREKVIVASPTDNAQGPIVALSLGLAITLILLVFVGCRLRNVRKRLRKGRPLHSNEADYLINGMYL